MIAAENIRSIVRECAPTAAVDILRLLGWSSSRAHVDHLAGSPNEYARLILGSGLTGAGTQSAAQEDLWWTGFQQGARYHLAVVDRSVRWYDFFERREWQAGIDDDLRPLLNLAPDRFLETGAFAPAADLGRSQRLPGKPPREYLTDLVKGWYIRYLRWDESSRDKSPLLVQRDFVNLIARLVFIRTIEDLGNCEWLRPDTLKRIAESKSVSQSLSGLFQQLKAKVNSQVFSNTGDSLPQQDAAIAELLTALYSNREHRLDFAAIEFSMIGRFYERVLGDHHEVRDTEQVALIGPQERAVTPISHRRELGQYYTPPVYAEYLARKVVMPRVRAARDVTQLPRVADIAVGSGEMLTASLHAMLSVPRFRTPESVRFILKNKLVGIDINSTATQLTALNLIRTSLLLCPELLEGEPVFPNVEGLHDLDALRPRAFSNIGPMDVILTNPPFRGQPDWKDTSKKPRGMMAALSGQSNKATAFLVRAAEVVEKEGSIGIVMPNQFFTSRGNKQARCKLLERLNIVELVDNQGARVFDGVSNQPGMLIARVNPEIKAPNMVLTTLAPPRNQARAILSTGLDSSPGAKREAVRPPSPNDKSWLNEITGEVATGVANQAVPTIPVSDLLPYQLIRAPIASIGPFRGAWTITRRAGHFYHKFTNSTLPVYESQFIRPTFNPKRPGPGGDRPSSAPDGEELTIFPYVAQQDGSYKPVPLAEWRRLDSRIHQILRRICEAAKSSLPLSNRDHERYRQELVKGLPRFYRLNNLRADTSLLIAARAARIQSGSEAWSSWIIPAEKRVVPLDGLCAQSADFELLQVIACLLSTNRIFAQLRGLGSARGAGWVEVSPRIASSLLIPDINSPRLSSRLGELKASIASPSKNKAELSRLSEQMWNP